MDENFIFDPLKKFTRSKKLTPDKTLWRDIKGSEEIEEYVHSIDGILGKVLEKKTFDSLKALDKMLESLDDAREATTDANAEYLFEKLECNYVDIAAFPHREYVTFLDSIGSAVIRSITHEKVQECYYEAAIEDFISLIIRAVQCDAVTYCKRNVNGTILDKITVQVKIDKQDASLQISSKPDLFLYCRPRAGLLERRIVLGVIEVKGKVNDRDVLHSSDEEDDEEVPDPTLSKKRRSCTKKVCGNIRHKLYPVEEEDEVEQDIIEELTLEQLMQESPEWLTRIDNLPAFAVQHLRQFLPQLIGEMLCVFRSEVMRPFKTTNGMQFGIGVVGFDVYFVTVIDPSHKSRDIYGLINDNSSYLSVFITKPFNMLIRKDRRKIIKILTASLYLDKLGV